MLRHATADVSARIDSDKDILKKIKWLYIRPFYNFNVKNWKQKVNVKYFKKLRE